jgi:hypothetical protein
MPQIFHRSTNTIAKVSLFGFPFVVAFGSVAQKRGFSGSFHFIRHLCRAKADG